MVFSSLIFLFAFLPAVILLYFITPDRFKNLILLLSSLLFYTWGEGLLVALLIGSAIFNFFLGKYVERGNKKVGLIATLIVNFSVLGIYKYLDFSLATWNSIVTLIGLNSAIANLPHIALPIGISFYTFQAVSYVMDIYYGKTKSDDSFIDFATYLCMFPQLVAGPIVRYTDIKEQLTKKDLSVDKAADGVRRFIIGLAKKVLIANTMASVADSVFNSPVHDVTMPIAWIGIFAYTMQIYFDFSGYSDMAIGLGKIFGIDFLENFNYPYISKSIKEFWRRWHISLSSWFRDYLYIPLGGNRKGVNRTYINLFIVFAVTGLWHGANWTFVAWGLYHGLFIVIERIGFSKILEKTHVAVQHLYTILVFTIGWVFFRADNIGHAFAYLRRMFSLDMGDSTLNEYWCVIHLSPIFYVTATAAILFSMPVYKLIYEKYVVKSEKLEIVQTVLLFVALFLSILSINSGNYNPFIYFRF